MWTRTHHRRTRLVTLLIASLTAGLLVASPAQAAEVGIQKAPSVFDSTSSDSRITFSWRRPVSRSVQKVKYTVYIAGNRNMRKDANYQVKTAYGYTRSSTTTTARDKAVFAIKSPTSYSYGARIWVKVVTKTIHGKYSKADPQKASNRYSAGLQPADPSSSALQVTPTCKGFTARWAAQPARSRGVKVQVAGSTNAVYVGYEPSRSVTVSTLTGNTDYRVRAQATSVGERSAWTDWQSFRTKTCASRVVRVGSFNLQKEGANPVSWNTRAPKAASQIVAADDDIVGLQEAPSFSYKQVQKLQSELKERGKPYGLADSSNGGVHLIYRNDRFGKVGTSEAYYLTAEDERKENALAVAQAFRAREGTNPTFIVVSLHSTEGKQSEVAGALRIAEQVKTANRLASDTPVVFTGDVVLANTEEKRTAVRAELSKTLSDAEFYRPGRRLDLYNSRNALIKCPPHVSGIKVDGIFASDTAAVTYWEMPKYGFSNGCFRKGFPSDHNLLTANVWIPAT